MKLPPENHQPRADQSAGMTILKWIGTILLISLVLSGILYLFFGNMLLSAKDLSFLRAPIGTVIY